MALHDFWLVILVCGITRVMPHTKINTKIKIKKNLTLTKILKKLKLK